MVVCGRNLFCDLINANLRIQTWGLSLKLFGEVSRWYHRIFKVLLTHPEGKQVLIDVISTVLERTVIEAQVRNIELPVMDIEEKAERFDVNCTIDNGDQIDVEMHSSEIVEIGTKRTDFINKYVYYLTDLHSSQKSKGMMYHELVKTYQITFLPTQFSQSFLTLSADLH